MLEHNNPAVDVDDLMARIQQEVAKRGVGYEPVTFNGDGSQPHPLASIEGLLNTAQAKAEVRTKWSGQLRLFPFDRSPKLQGVVLRVLAFVFKDQRHVNFALIAAIVSRAAVNGGLLRRLVLPERSAKAAERLREMDSGT